MRKLATALVVSLVAIVITALLVGIDHKQRNAETPTSIAASGIEKLYQQCLADMAASTCKVMGTGAVKAVAAPGEMVFIAGVGAVPAKDYQEMYAAGEAMCNVIRAACQANWTGAQCQTAQRVFRF